MENEVMNVARLFTAEIGRLESRKEGTHLRLDLVVRWVGWGRDAKPQVELTANFDNNSTYETIKASSIGKLMDEVYRRLDFEDRDTAHRDANNAALVAITDQRSTALDDEIPY